MNMQGLYLLPLVCVIHATTLEGHLKPLGQQRKSEGRIEILVTVPNVKNFFDKYIVRSKPVVFKGAAKHIPAYKKWTDEYLKEHFGNLRADVEEGKKENRSLAMWTWTFKKFIEKYQKEDVYMVHSLEKAMRGDLRLFPCISCGGFSRVLSDVIMWFSSGGTKSVLHNDNIDNINCLFSGSKTLYMVDWKYREFVKLDAKQGAYSNVDVDAVDLVKYEGLSKAPWWEANMEAGDCLFIPARWFHQVRSFADNNRNMAVNIWFYNMAKINSTDCDVNKDAGTFVPLDKFDFGNVEGVRFLLALQLENAPLHVRKMAKFLRMSNGGYWESALLKEMIRILDQDGDEMVTIDEVNNLTNKELTTLSSMFPGLAKEDYGDEDGYIEEGVPDEGGSEEGNESPLPSFQDVEDREQLGNEEDESLPFKEEL